MKTLFNMTADERKAWLDRLASLPEEPSGCPSCGAIAGHCGKYPNCPGNPTWQPATEAFVP
jgi:hypothetical protein